MSKYTGGVNVNAWRTVYSPGLRFAGPPSLPQAKKKDKLYVMNRIAFKMKLFPGFAAEYKERHDEIWPGLVEILKDAGISDYSIFIDEETNWLFAVLRAESIEKVDDLSANPIMQQWWQFMSDIMECNTDNSPVSIPLKEVFYLA